MFILRIASIALALLVVSGVPVSAQPSPVCTANVANPTMARAYGLSELMGDLVVFCTGVPPLPAGAPIPQFNLTVSLNAPITSRILDPNTRATEALLLVNEPGSTGPSSMVNGYGPTAPQILCPTPLTGCPEQVGYVGSIAVPVLPAVSTPPPVQDAPNVFQGVSTAINQVTFFGVPLVPSSLVAVGPGWTATTFRIVNIRANVAAAGPFQGQSSILAAVSASLPVLNNPVLSVAFVFSGFESPNRILNFVPCPAGSICPLSTLRFAERFAAAAKSRLERDAQGNLLPAQNVPGRVYPGGESGFYAPAMLGANPATATAGLADFGTRLKAIIRTPPGVRLWVATGLTWSGSGPYVNALFIRSENAPFSPAPADTVIGNRPVAELPVVDGTAVAVWEVLYANPASLDRFEFPLFVSYPTGIAPLEPLRVIGSLAPTFDEGAFPPDGVFAQGPAYPIPRFLRPPAILLPPSLTLAPGQFMMLPLMLSGPAGPAGVAITLTSANPSIATVTSSTVVPAGAVSPDRRLPAVIGLQFGQTVVTASSPYFESGTVTVNVALAATFSPAALTVSRSSRQARPLLVLSAPAPAGGLTVTLSSDNPAVASVPETLFIPPDAMSVSVPITPSGLGSALIKARAPFLTMDALLPVTVVP